jgi:hypothetical protein
MHEHLACRDSLGARSLLGYSRMPTVGHPCARVAKIAVSCAALAAVGATTRTARAANDLREGEIRQFAPVADGPSDIVGSAPGSARATASPNRCAMSLGAGYAAQTLYGVSMDGAGFEAVLGWNLGKVTLAGDIEVIHGSTEYGLTTNTFSVGVHLERDIDRFHIGGGIRLGALEVDRVTNGESLVGTILGGIYVRASVELFRFHGDRDAVYLAAKGSLDTVGVSCPVGGLYGAVIGAGVRF